MLQFKADNNTARPTAEGAPMFPGTQAYPEGRYRPVRIDNAGWDVWCATGASQILATREYEPLLDANPKDSFLVNFANGSCANVWPAHPLWIALKGLVTKGYTVEVFSLSVRGTYGLWTGEEGSLGCFDAIKITKK